MLVCVCVCVYAYLKLDEYLNILEKCQKESQLCAAIALACNATLRGVGEGRVLPNRRGVGSGEAKPEQGQLTHDNER